MGKVMVVYKITYPNGKIYIGQDRTNSINYFGSADSRLVEKDFSSRQRRSFSVKKDIIWESKTATNEQLNKKEIELILKYGSNNPKVGYNKKPKLKNS